MKKSFTGLLLFCNLVLFSTFGSAQVTSTPYSNFGIGDLQYNHFGRSKGMGGTAIGLRLPNTLNSTNPASYSSIGTQAFLFDGGVEYQQTSYKTDNLAQIANGGNLTHLAIGFPLLQGHWYTSVGVQPFSTIGYDVNTSTYDIEAGDIVSQYKGSGGINKIYWGHSVQIVKGLSVGVNASYLFGAMVRETTSTVADEKTESSLTKTSESIVRDFMLEYGAQYSFEVSKNFSLTLGATLTQASNIKATNSSLITNRTYVDGRTTYNPTTYLAKIDTLLNTADDTKGINMPLQYGVGASCILWNKLILAADYKKSLWSKENVEGIRGSVSDAQVMNFGMEYMPNYRSPKYWDRVLYRAGFEMNQSYWNVLGNQINGYGVTIGLGLPMRRSASIFDLAFEFGKRGSLSTNPIEETYIKASLSFTLQDIWFIKRKFN